MKAIAVLPTLFVVAFCHSTPLVDYRKTFSLPPQKNCTAPGLLCETCTDLVACVETDGHFTKNFIQTCPADKKCLKGQCTEAADPFCDGIADLAFPCQKMGIFPDPFYCNKFVLCVNMGQKLQGYLGRCEDGLGFNIETGICDVKLEGGECKEDEWPIPVCEKAGDSGALKGKPMEFYTCEEYGNGKKVLYPVIDICPHAEIYDNYKCVAN